MSTRHKSVVDYDDADDLRQALHEMSLEWRLPVKDAEAEEQTVENELQRLLTLKSYLVLDAEKEEAFDKLTEEACKLYKVPTSNISLVDFGRQFALSNTGTPGDVRETTRQVAFCAHTILSKKGICVVADTQKDDRFRQNKLVTGPPYLRFYAGAPLVSPEGYRLGTFCVEGPDPRPGGLTKREREKLVEFAQKTMDLLVERRERLQTQLKAPFLNDDLKRYAAVATNLGGHLYVAGECLGAMKLLQESVQTLMQAEEFQNDKLPPEEKRQDMAQLARLLSNDSLSDETRTSLIQNVLAHVPQGEMPAIPARQVSCGGGEAIPGLFGSSSKFRRSTEQRHQASLVFSEPFMITMDVDSSGLPFEERQFMIPMEQCSKATLFNMGLIHYQWGSPDSAMQFFDISASLSSDALSFDPVVLGCLNNMAQIHLQYGRPDDAVNLLSDAMARGNAALGATYGDDGSSGEDDMAQAQCHKRSSRLRRKLARTVMNLGHAFYFNCGYVSAMRACKDALSLLHHNMEVMEVAAAWYNIAVLHYHEGKLMDALKYMDLFLEKAKLHLPSDHVQIADGYYQKGMILFEMGLLYESMKPLNESLRIRELHLGPNHSLVAESLSMIGKVLQAREEYDFAVEALRRALAIQRLVNGAGGLCFDTAQTLLDMGRALHILGQLDESLELYQEVLTITEGIFGEKHVFVAKVCNIIGNLHVEKGSVDDSIAYFERASQIQVENGEDLQLNVVEVAQSKETVAFAAGA